MIYFGRVYGQYGRGDWEFERQLLFSEIMELLVIWQLGSRRTLFAWREEQLHDLKFSELEGEEPGIKMGMEVGKSVKRRWFKLLIEMVGVVGFTVVTAGGVGWQVASLLRN